MTPFALVVACVCAAVASYLLARRIVIPLLKRRGVIDHPSARSSHETPVPRGGGVAVAGGLVVGVAVAILLRIPLDGVSIALGVEADELRALLPVVAAFVFGLVGLVDDLNSLSPMGRLIAQGGFATVFAIVILMVTHVGVLGALAVVGSIILIVNGTNFMDGLNTLISVWAGVTALWLGVLAFIYGPAQLSVPVIALTGALIGFLPLNASPARAFLGDVGSYAIGGFLSVAVWVLWSEGVPALALVAPFIVPLFDVLFTLGRRIFGGENLFTAHRKHIYQRLNAAGVSHGAVSALHVTAVALCLAATLPSLLPSSIPGSQFAAVVWLVVVAVYAAGPTWVRSRERRSEP